MILNTNDTTNDVFHKYNSNDLRKLIVTFHSIQRGGNIIIANLNAIKLLTWDFQFT